MAEDVRIVRDIVEDAMGEPGTSADRVLLRLAEAGFVIRRAGERTPPSRSELLAAAQFGPVAMSDDDPVER